MPNLRRRKKSKDKEDEEILEEESDDEDEDEYENENEIGAVERLTTQLLESNAKIVELEAKTKTTLTGSQFLTIVLVGPLFLAFVTSGNCTAPGYNPCGIRNFCQPSDCSSRSNSRFNAR